MLILAENYEKSSQRSNLNYRPAHMHTAKLALWRLENHRIRQYLMDAIAIMAAFVNLFDSEVPSIVSLCSSGRF